MEMKTLTFVNLEGNEVEVHYQEKIDFKTLTAIPSMVRDVVFAEQLGGYAPQMYDTTFAHGVIVAYTDYRPVDLGEVYQLMTETNFVDKLYSLIDATQLNLLTTWTKDIIEFNKNRDGLDKLVAVMKNMPMLEEAMEDTQEDNVVPLTAE